MPQNCVDTYFLEYISNQFTKQQIDWRGLFCYHQCDIRVTETYANTMKSSYNFSIILYCIQYDSFTV